MRQARREIRKILFVTLSNIGDVILTLPALDYLKALFPASEITVICGPRAQGVFTHSPLPARLVVYDKQCPFMQKIQLLLDLQKERFDAIIDLRNSIFGAVLSAPYRVPFFLRIPSKIMHMKDRHLFRAARAFCRSASLPEASGRRSILFNDDDQRSINTLLAQHGIAENDRLVIVSAGARSHTKRWNKEKFAELIRSFIGEAGIQTVLVGDKDDAGVNLFLTRALAGQIIDITGSTTITQLACLLQKASLVITNDSANLHLASYLNKPVIALFGPTDEARYGPWSQHSLVVKKDIYCRPCQRAECRFGRLDCLDLIKTKDVEAAVKNFLSGAVAARRQLYPKADFKRILIVRTDRLGDVLLSTPAIKALRDAYPSAYIAMMVSAHAVDLIEGNPYLDEVIVFNKQTNEKGAWGAFRCAVHLRSKKFDVCFILHPTVRVHVLMYLAAIPRRIGYDRKCGFLLTDRIVHDKQAGEKHESEYALDLLRYAGIEPGDNKPFMPIREESEAWVEKEFQKAGILRTDKLLAIHPAASCRSKLWPEENFAKVCDTLIERAGFKVVIVAGPEDAGIAVRIRNKMRHPAVTFAGKASLSQLASILKRCRLFISNDSGPVHIASALGIPVVVIFGRNQKGLSPVRWGPLGEGNIVLHKNVGCVECLAHNCIKDFACIKAVTPDEVIKVVADFNYYL